MATTNEGREMRVAVDRIVGFAKHLGEAHMNLACHAAFPLVLTPDLLYKIWASFVPEVPWTAVARVLLSRLCRQVGYEMYEMDIPVRNLLLKELKEQFGQERLDELAEFLMDYVVQRLTADDLDTQDLAQAQEWTALAYTKPNEAARELAEALRSRVKQENMAEVLRLASLVETLAEPLVEAGFEPLLIYSRGMGGFVRGDLEVAANQFGQVAKQESEVEVAGVSLVIPRQSSINLESELLPISEIPIEQLQLSGRVYSSLKRVGLNSVADILDFTKKDLLEIKNFGHKSAQEVNNALQRRLGITLAQNRDYSESRFEAIFDVINTVVFSKTGKPLNKVQKIIIYGSWQGHTYEQIAKNFKYSQQYIEIVSRKLWKLISHIIERPFHKKDCRAARLEWIVREDFSKIIKQNTSTLDTEGSHVKPNVELEIINNNLSFEQGTDYIRLQRLLAAGKWKDADQETAAIVLKVSDREKEGWLGVEKVRKLSCEALKVIDELWREYSDNRFGFSVQQYIWEGTFSDSNKQGYQGWWDFGESVGWLRKKKWLTYDKLTFSLNAPEGHLPCFRLLIGMNMTGRVHSMHQFKRFSSLMSRVAYCNRNREFLR